MQLKLDWISGFAILVWLPSAIRTTFPQDVEQFAIINSLVKGLAGSFSSIAGGELLVGAVFESPGLAADGLRSRGTMNDSQNASKRGHTCIFSRNLEIYIYIELYRNLMLNLRDLRLT